MLSSLHWLLRLASSTRYQVSGRSMLPILAPGDRLLVDIRAYRRFRPVRGDLVLVHHPDQPGRKMVKRVIGLPGERVSLEGSVLLVDGAPCAEPYLAPGMAGVGLHEWRLGPEQVVVLGDNRIESTDSRNFGPLSRRLLIGRAWYRYAPAARAGPLDPPENH